MEFVLSNVVGTVNLMNVCKAHWTDLSNHIFYHISTDEVYGSLGQEGLFEETTAYDPRSPYSASKASSDHFVRRSEEHTSELQSRPHLVCRLLLEKKKKTEQERTYQV